jgi:hypothetical protein
MSLAVGRNVVLFWLTVLRCMRRFRFVSGGGVSGSGVRTVRGDVSTANFRMAATVWLIAMWLALVTPLLCKDNQT